MVTNERSALACISCKDRADKSPLDFFDRGQNVIYFLRPLPIKTTRYRLALWAAGRNLIRLGHRDSLRSHKSIGGFDTRVVH
jgi:hypothetical protein